MIEIVAVFLGGFLTGVLVGAVIIQKLLENEVSKVTNKMIQETERVKEFMLAQIHSEETK